MNETGWRIVLYVAFRRDLKDECTLKETKQTSVNNEPISFSSEASDTQILCESKDWALFLIMETFVELADLAVLWKCCPGIDKVILVLESWPMENGKEKSYREDDELGEESASEDASEEA
jgi:hypothetical protein